jgi:hypothetical protein
MARKKGLSPYTEQELVEELARRHAEREFRDGMTMSEIEQATEKLKADTGPPSVALMLSRMKPEKPTAKACPRCGKRTPIKARDRERTVRSLSGPVTFKRNYHYCEACKYGFYPVDRLLDLPEEGELTTEMEKRVLDFAVNDVYGECASRWGLHYREPISDNLLRRVVSRVGAQCETADQGRLQEQLKPRAARGYPIGTGAVESAHRHVLQTRMKRAGQHGALRNARRMARLRAAYRTAGATTFYDGIRRAVRDSRKPRQRGRRQTFRYARQGRRDLDSCARSASN